MAELDPQQKVALIKENLQEVLKPEILEDVIVKQDRPLEVYWGKFKPRMSTRECHMQPLTDALKALQRRASHTVLISFPLSSSLSSFGRAVG